MVRAYRRRINQKAPDIIKTPEEIVQLEKSRWERIKADNEQLLTPLT